VVARRRGAEEEGGSNASDSEGSGYEGLDALLAREQEQPTYPAHFKRVELTEAEVQQAEEAAMTRTRQDREQLHADPRTRLRRHKKPAQASSSGCSTVNPGLKSLACFAVNLPQCCS
jgi:hypothetical protein